MSKTMTQDAIDHDRACRARAARSPHAQLPAGATLFRWLGTALQVIGALILAANIDAVVLAYKLMLCGAFFWFVIAMLRRDRALAAMQAVFVVLNLIGILRWAA